MRNVTRERAVGTTSREVRIVFEVDEDCPLSWAELWDVAERIVTAAEPDPPVLTFDRIEVTQ